MTGEDKDKKAVTGFDAVTFVAPEAPQEESKEGDDAPQEGDSAPKEGDSS